MRMFRAWIFLVLYSARRQWRSRKVLVAGLFLALTAALIGFMSFRRGLTPSFFGEWVVVRLFGLFIFPMLMLMFGTAAIGDDRDEKTLVYLITRPLARWGICLGKWLGVIPAAWLFGLGGLWCLCKLAEWRAAEPMAGLFEMFAGAFFFASLAYLSLFHFVALVFRHSMLISILYVFFIEVFIGNVPGILKRLSIHFYTASMVYEAGRAIGIEPPNHVIFQPIEAGAARWVLAGIAGVFLAAACWVFDRQEN